MPAIHANKPARDSIWTLIHIRSLLFCTEKDILDGKNWQRKSCRWVGCGGGEGDPVEQRESFTRAQEEAARSCCVREYGTAGTDPHHDTLQYQLSLITVITIIPEPNSRHNQLVLISWSNPRRHYKRLFLWLTEQSFHKLSFTTYVTKIGEIGQIWEPKLKLLNKSKIFFKYGN